MTVWEFMSKMGRCEFFRIFVGTEDVTKDEPTSVEEVRLSHEERENVLGALERLALSVDLEDKIIYAEG